MNGLSLTAAVNKQFNVNAGLAEPKLPGGQTSLLLNSQLESIASCFTAADPKDGVASEGFVLDGFFLGTFEFDSLTGHPGIRY